jgi:NAD(P)-dependent dehydrogenase (short-subunit alcohol dehydrogenase family)
LARLRQTAGPIETGVFATIPQEMKNAFVALVPMGRIGQPEEIASTALFLVRTIPVSLPELSCLSMVAGRRSDAMHRRNRDAQMNSQTTTALTVGSFDGASHSSAHQSRSRVLTQVPFGQVP